MKRKKAFWLATVAGLSTGGQALAVDVPEIEANDSKATATPATLAPGDTLLGTSIGASTVVPGPTSADYFRVRASAAPRAIYRQTLTLTTTGTAGHTATLRGRTQSGTGVIDEASDASVQTSFTLANGSRVNVWYGFGYEEEVFYRVAGTAATTGQYNVAFARTAVTPTPLGTNLATPGQYSIRVTGSGGTTDPELWIYNADTLQPIDGFNNDDTIGSGLVSTVTRDFPAGNYLLCVGDYNIQTNLPSPPDEAGRGENVMDFPNAVSDSDRETSYTAAVEIHQGPVTGPTVATGSFSKTQDFEIMWVSFTVGGSSACPADLDSDGVAPGTPDGAVDINDLLFFLVEFENGSTGADLDNDGVDPAQPDGAVTVDDLLFFLVHFENGC